MEQANGSGEEEGTSQQNGAVGDQEDTAIGNEAGSTLHPNDDQGLKRDVRAKYRALINLVKENREEFMNPSSVDGLSKVLYEASKLFTHDGGTSIQALDAHLLVVTADLFKEKVSQLFVEGNAFDHSAFSEHLLNFMGLNRLENEDEENGVATNGYLPQDAWYRVAKRAQCCFKTAPTFHYMMGSFVAEPQPPKQRVERQRKVPTKEAQRTMPTQLKEMDESHQETTAKEVEKILGFLRSYHAEDPTSPISYYEFVIDPTSFSRSVENMFHTSFLIRDGLARMYLDTNKLPCIAPVTVTEDHGDNGESAARKQCIMSISMQSWKEIIDAFEITAPMIPPNTQNVE